MRRRAIANGWDAFWFKPVSAEPIALFRILFGVLAIVNALLLAPDLLMWYGNHGVYSGETWRRSTTALHHLLFGLLPSGDGWLIALFVLFTVAAFSLTIGLFTRTSAFVVWLALCWFHDRNPYVINSLDILLRVDAFWLMFTHAGAVLSLDRLWRVHRGREAEPSVLPPWGQRLLQVQLALMYFSTASWKMLSGRAWWDGTAAYYNARWTTYRGWTTPYVFDHEWTCQLVCWSTLAVETALWTLVWVPKFRNTVLLAGVFLHLAVAWSMNIPLFSAGALIMYVTFVSPEDLARLRKKILFSARARFAESTVGPFGAW